jgi:hypothetical protein
MFQIPEFKMLEDFFDLRTKDRKSEYLEKDSSEKSENVLKMRKSLSEPPA